MAALDIEYDRLDYADRRTRMAILELLSRAQLLTGFDGFGGKLYIEVYPDEAGGCTFCFTVLRARAVRQGEKRAAGPLPDAPCAPELFGFETINRLIAAASSLYRRAGHRIYRSALYRWAGRYYLLLVPFRPKDPLLRAILSEYCALTGRRVPALAFLREHGQQLAEEDAVERLAGY